MDKVYIVCQKVFFENTMVDIYIMKVVTDLEKAKDEMQKQAKNCILGDSKWSQTDTNGVNFIELKNGLYTRRYYILEKFIDE